MAQCILTVTTLCMMAALCEQLFGKSRYFGAVRFVLGLEIIRQGILLMDRFFKLLN